MSKVSAEAEAGYAKVSALWKGQKVPPMTAAEGEKAGRLLWAAFTGKPFTGSVKHTSGNRRSWIFAYPARMIVNPEEGWETVLHAFSHSIHRKRFPRGGGKRAKRPHAAEHAALEVRVVKMAIEGGWLTGALVPKPRKVPDRPKKAPPDRLLVEQARVAEATKRWTTKYRRAGTALAQLAKRAARIERALAKRAQEPTPSTAP